MQVKDIHLPVTVSEELIRELSQVSVFLQMEVHLPLQSHIRRHQENLIQIQETIQVVEITVPMETKITTILVDFRMMTAVSPEMEITQETVERLEMEKRTVHQMLEGMLRAAYPVVQQARELSLHPAVWQPIHRRAILQELLKQVLLTLQILPRPIVQM